LNFIYKIDVILAALLPFIVSLYTPSEPLVFSVECFLCVKNGMKGIVLRFSYDNDKCPMKKYLLLFRAESFIFIILNKQYQIGICNKPFRAVLPDAIDHNCVVEVFIKHTNF